MREDRVSEQRGFAGSKLASLRAEIAAIERRDAPRPVLQSGTDQRGADCSAGPGRNRKFGLIKTGIDTFDDPIGGGVPNAGLIEITSAAMRDCGSVTGFVSALIACIDDSDRVSAPVLWISTGDVEREGGVPHMRGLASFGLTAERVMFVHVPTMTDALWVAEEAARTRGLAAVLFDMRGSHAAFGLKQSRRLHLRACAGRTTLFVLQQSRVPQGSAAPLRLLVGPAPSYLPDKETAASRFIGPPGFAVTIDKNKFGPTGSTHHLYWRYHERCFFITDASSGYGAGHRDAYSVGEQAFSNAANAHSGRLFSFAGNRPHHARTARSAVAKTG